MGNVFSEKPLKEIVRENQRMLKKSIRELEKEIANLKKQETKLTQDIKKMAKQNQMVCHFSPTCSVFIQVYCRVLFESWPKIWSVPETTSLDS